jgi:hypothetical protein
MSLNQETRNLISWWKIRGLQEPDPFIKFFIMYMCLDAWMTSESGHDRDDQKLRWLKETGNPLREHWQETPHITVSLRGLKKIGQVEDMRPRHRGEYKYLTDMDDFGEVIDFIYQIRCNLFHGGKSAVNTHDRRLVELSSKILANWIEWTLAKTRVAAK